MNAADRRLRIAFVVHNYKVVAIDRMQVTGYLDAGDAWRVHQGQDARIMPKLEGGTCRSSGRSSRARSPSS
ncbi:MAG: hypothetical protein JO116_15150, partial [Planctomycetaceae bacterium]|nr:hypothetical protein [Planctomycetaceae bacterium]